MANEAKTVVLYQADYLPKPTDVDSCLVSERRISRCLNMLFESGLAASGLNAGILGLQSGYLLEISHFKHCRVRRLNGKINANRSWNSDFSLNKVVEKIAQALVFPLHAWGDDDAVVFYSGPHQTRDLGEQLREYVFTSQKGKQHIFFTHEGYSLKNQESPLLVYTVSRSVH